MDEERCIAYIITSLKSLDESDTTFIRKIYTLIRKHMERKRRRD